MGDLISWLLEQDSWMNKSWGWEVVQVCYEKVNIFNSIMKGAGRNAIDEIADESGKDKLDEKPEPMQVESNGETNQNVENEKREIFEKIVSGVESCYERQAERDGYWLKEWFAMVVRKFHGDVAGMKGTGWVAEMLNIAEEYRRRFV